METTSINFSGSIRIAGDTAYSESLPTVYNGKKFLCMYFSVGFYCNGSFNNGGGWNTTDTSYKPVISLDLQNRRVKMFTPVEHSGTIYISGTVTGIYL